MMYLYDCLRRQVHSGFCKLVYYLVLLKYLKTKLEYHVLINLFILPLALLFWYLSSETPSMGPGNIWIEANKEQ